MAIFPSVSDSLTIFDRVVNFFKISGVYYGIVEKQKNNSENSILIEIINREKEAITNIIIEVTSDAKIIGKHGFEKFKFILKEEYLEDNFLLVTISKLNPRQIVSFSFDYAKSNEQINNDITVHITCAEGKKMLSMNKMVREKDENVTMNPLFDEAFGKRSYEEIKKDILK